MNDKLMPKQITEEMAKAFWEEFSKSKTDGLLMRCYKAMYAVAPQLVERQPDDAAVDRFAAAMKAKLNKKRQEGREGWQSMTAEQLSALLHEHVHKGDPVDA